jgi:hypothetical protein
MLAAMPATIADDGDDAPDGNDLGQTYPQSGR